VSRFRRYIRRTPRTPDLRGDAGDDVDRWDEAGDGWEALEPLRTAMAAADERRPVVDGAAPAKHPVGSAWRVQVATWGADRERLRRGLEYLASGAVDEVTIERGHVKATVNGSRRYTVQIVVGLPGASAAEPLLARLRGTSGAATIAALTEALRAEAMALLHDTVRRMVVVCTCPDGAGCKHSVAVVHGLGACLDRDPGLLLTLWGLDDAVATGGEFVIAPLAPGREALTEDLAALFGVDLVTPTTTAPTPVAEVERGHLRVLGIPAHVLDAWVREGLLRSAGRPDVYVRTAELDRRIAEYLAW
jgi:hypothetical protein